MYIRYLLVQVLFMLILSSAVEAQETGDDFKFGKGSVLTNFSLSLGGGVNKDGGNQEFESDYNFGNYRLDVHYMVTKHIGVGAVFNYMRASATFESFERTTRGSDLFEYGIQAGYFRKVVISDWQPLYAFANVSISRSRIQGRIDYEFSPDSESNPEFTPIYDVSIGAVKPISKRIALRFELERSTQQVEFLSVVGSGANREVIRTVKWPVVYSLNAGFTLALF